MQNMENNSLQNINELKFIQKIMEDNDVFNETKIEYKYFSDPLAKVLFSIQAEWITKMGEFKPLLHFKNLCEDEARITRFNNMNYPFKLTNNPQDIVDFLSKFEDNSIRYQTLERYITDNWIKRKMEETALGMLDKVNDSSVDIRNVLVNTSLKLDNLLYNSEDDVVCKNEEELVDDFIAYIRDPNVESYIKTGIDIIDKSSGGTPKESFIAIAACPKMGKSMILVDACVDNLLRGRHCLFFSIEMSEREVFLRMVARYANFNYDQMSKKQLTKEENEQLIAKAIEFKERVKGRLQIYQNRSGILVKNIESHIAKRRKGGQQVDDVFIDYLQILEETTKPNKIEKMDELCKQVRQLKQKMGIRVFIPAQLGASAKTKPIEEINEFDIWYAKNLARECDILLILHNDQEYEKCTLMRYALARINYTDDVYFFPNADFNRAYIGEGQVYDKNKIETLAEKKHWRKRGQYDEEDNGKGDIDWMNFK